MSMHTVGSDATYILPASVDSIPESFRSNRSAKPIPCVLQTVNLPSLSGEALASGTSVIQVPCGASAGIMLNPYLSFKITVKTAADADADVKFNFSTASATACISRLSTYVNSVQVDNLTSADAIYDMLFAHSTSRDWMGSDAAVLMYSDQVIGKTKDTNFEVNAVVPLIGLLGSQQAFPLYLINGQLQIQIDWNTVARSLFCAGTIAQSIRFNNVQLVYDRLQPEQAFIDSVRGQMMQGQNFVYAYTNYQCVNRSIAGAAGITSNFNYGLNVSSLRGVVQTQVLASTLSAATRSASIANGLTQFRVSLDGRLVNSNTLSNTGNQALLFAEAQKCFSRLYDSSISDLATTPALYSSNYFMVGVSAQRINEGLAFAGSPVSVVSIEDTQGTDAAAATAFVLFICDYQMLIDASGSVQLVR